MLAQAHDLNVDNFEMAQGKVGRLSESPSIALKKAIQEAQVVSWVGNIRSLDKDEVVLKESIGTGSFATVYKGLMDDTCVAVKA